MSPDPSDTPSRAAVEAVWRAESARLIGALVRFVAEDVAQEALLRALARWPAEGIPQRPGAWLMTTAKRVAVDRARHRQMADGKQAAIAEDAYDVDDALDVVIDKDEHAGVADDVLRMMFIACHPVLPKDARVALTLRWVAGLSTAEIARAFLTPEPTVAQRLVRAKRTLTEARVPFVVPTGDARRERIPPILEAIYLVFNEGTTTPRSTA